MFEDFAEKIRDLSPSGSTEDELEGFLLTQSDGSIRMYYAPFDWINTKARVIIVGITPGRDSMLNALRAAAAALQRGSTLEHASKQGKRAGSFSNMRFTIARMLDDLGIPDVLGIEQSLELFGTRYDLLHPTSCVRYPVLVWKETNRKWVNYTGHSPKLLKWTTSQRYIEHLLASELQQIPDALIIPRGKAVDAALQHLSEMGVIDARRCLFGFPHASGANGHRVKFFNERREQLRRRVTEWQNQAQ